MAAAVVGSVVALAQTVEYAVVRQQANLADDLLRQHLLGPLYLSLTFNRGSSFSMMSGGGWLPVLLASLVAAAMAVVVWRADRWLVVIGGSLALGGGISNLVDRAHHGAVADYLWTSFWPTFNLADAAITVGIALVLAGLLLPRHEASGA